MLVCHNILEIANDSTQRWKKLDQNEIDSIKNAVEEAGIPQIHPDKMESFAEYLVEKARQSE